MVLKCGPEAAQSLTNSTRMLATMSCILMSGCWGKHVCEQQVVVA